MNILLIEAPYDYGRLEAMTKPHFPLGLGYIAAFLRQQGHQVRLLLSLTPEELQHQLQTFQPELVGISCMTPTFPSGSSYLPGGEKSLPSRHCPGRTARYGLERGDPASSARN